MSEGDKIVSRLETPRTISSQKSAVAAGLRKGWILYVPYQYQDTRSLIAGNKHCKIRLSYRDRPSGKFGAISSGLSGMPSRS